MPVIDVHAHISTKPWADSLAKYNEALEKHYRFTVTVKTEAEMAKDFVDAGVKGLIVAWDAESNTGMPRTSNDYIAKVIKDHPEAFAGGWAMIDPWKGEMAIKELEHAIKDLGLTGLKFQQTAQGFFPNDRRFYPLYETCVSLKVPVQFHTGFTGLAAGTPGGMGIKLKHTQPIPYIDDVAADFPNLTIIACHPAWPWQEEMIAILLHKGNVFQELSGWSPKYFPDSLKREVRGRLQDKVMFRSDYPLITHQRLFADYEAEKYPAAILDKIYYQNAQRILGISV